VNQYVIAYIVIGVVLFVFLISFLTVIIIPYTKLYKDKHSQTIVKIQTDASGNPDIYIDGVKQELPEGYEEVRIPAGGQFDASKDIQSAKPAETKPADKKG
jgi:hypothetical protein